MHKEKILFYFIILFSLSSKAQFDQPQFKKFDKNNEIESNGVTEILVDKYHTFWIATFDGLIEFDGLNLTTHHIPHYQNGQIGSDIIFRIKELNDSIICIANVSGLAFFNKFRSTFELKAIQNLNPGSYITVTQITNLIKDTIIFFSKEYGANYYNPKLKSFSPYKKLNQSIFGIIYKIEKENNSYLIYSNKGLFITDFQFNVVNISERPNHYQWLNKLDSNYLIKDKVRLANFTFITAFEPKSNKSYFLKYNHLDETCTEVKINSRTSRSLYKDSFDKIWIYGAGEQPEIYDYKTNQSFVIPNSEINNSEIDFSICYNIYEDLEKSIWLCTNKGLFCYNPDQSQYKKISKNIPPTTFLDIIQINENQIWFSTHNNGIFKFNVKNQTFTNLKLSDQTGANSDNTTWQFYEDPTTASVWLLNEGGKIGRLNKSTFKIEFYVVPDFIDNALSIGKLVSNEIIIGSNLGIIYKFNAQENRFKPFYDLNKNVIGYKESISIEDLCVISESEILIGTLGSGILKLNYKTNQIKKYLPDSTQQKSIQSNFIYTLEKLDSNRVYLGTQDGLFAYNILDERIESLNSENKNNIGPIYNISKDQFGNLICVGGKGMFRVNWNQKALINLSRRSNINHLNLNQAKYISSQDRLYLTSEESIYELKINEEYFNPKFQPIIHSIQSFDKIINIVNANEIVLDSYHNSFTILFGISNIYFKDDFNLFYKMDDEDWRLTTNGEVNFSRLKGGSHTFKLKATYKGNQNISKEIEQLIYIEKMYYENGWFYALISIITLAILYFIYRIRINKLLAIEKVRFQLSRDLHDDMGSTLSTINILSSMANSKLQQDPRAAEAYLAKISAYSTQMMESMDDIVWSINPLNDSMQKIINRMREFAIGILEPKDIAIIFNISEKANDIKLSMSKRRNLFLIFKEIINNSAKYSNCSKVEVEIKIIHHHLILIVKDNGIGFNFNDEIDGNGLNNMKKRAQQMKAKLDINSILNLGTRITLNLRIKE